MLSKTNLQQPGIVRTTVIFQIFPSLLSIFLTFMTYTRNTKYNLTYKQHKKSYVLCIFYSKIITFQQVRRWLDEIQNGHSGFPCHAFFVSDRTRVPEEARNALGLMPIFCLNALENTSASLYPTISAICLTGSVVAWRSSDALFIRTPSRYS